MLLHYGERECSFARLQKEILEQLGDLSCLAWNSANGGYDGLVLAESPDNFRESAAFDNFADLSGLSFSGLGMLDLTRLRRRRVAGRIRYIYKIGLLTVGNQVHNVGIYLQKISICRYLRESHPVITWESEKDESWLPRISQTRVYVATRYQHLKSAFYEQHGLAHRTLISVRYSDGGVIDVDQAVPEPAWNDSGNYFYHNGTSDLFAVFLRRTINNETCDLGLLIHHKLGTGHGSGCLKLFRTLDYGKEVAEIRQLVVSDSVRWAVVLGRLPSLAKLRPDLDLKCNNETYVIRADLEEVYDHSQTRPDWVVALCICKEAEDTR
jgi:hypothetical protein